MGKRWMTKLERVIATLHHTPVDRCAVLEQLSYNPAVIADWTGKENRGFTYTYDDICRVIALTCDIAMPPHSLKGTARVTDDDGFTIQNDNWTSWHVSRPFTDEHGAASWIKEKINTIRNSFNAEKAAEEFIDEMRRIQKKIGETVLLNFSNTGFCDIFDSMGLEIFTFFQLDYPELLKEYMDLMTANELEKIHHAADSFNSPLILIPEDFATKQGPIFPPDFLYEYHYPYIKRLTEAWHAHGVKVIYHSDGNWKSVIPDLIGCGVDGFYCLEPSCGMDIVALKNQWPDLVWSGGVDGVDLMEFGSPDEVRREVSRHILETRALEEGGMFVATSSEINPPVPAANFRALVETVRSTTNPYFGK
jgi:uroporphyrinogen-III decarboxylase